MADYREINRANWDDRVPAHLTSEYYSVQRFLAEPDFISDVVRFDLPRLGDVAGLRGAHLQCHIGTDTISLARLGASMTGLDFSWKAVEAARKLASETTADAAFVQSDVYLAAEVLEAGEFDLVYTGVGSLSWLPDIRRWGGVVADLLRPADASALSGAMECVGGGEYRLIDRPQRLPHSYTLQAVKGR